MLDSFPRDLPDARIRPGSPALQADSLPSEPPGVPPARMQFTKRKELFFLQEEDGIGLRKQKMKHRREVRGGP